MGPFGVRPLSPKFSKCIQGASGLVSGIELIGSVIGIVRVGFVPFVFQTGEGVRVSVCGGDDRGQHPS
jgi:hypothetical protein